MGFIENKVAAEMAQWQGFKAAEINSQKIAEALTRPPKPDMGDLAFATFRFAKDVGMKPPELAAKLMDGAAAGELVESVNAAGPYLNIRLKRNAVSQAVLNAVEAPGNFGDGDDGKAKSLVIDLSSPNIAKPLAVHHLRSTMIGNAIRNLRMSQGWNVVGVNHLGDWGTGFGKLIAGLKRNHPEVGERADAGDDQPLGDMAVRELNAAYAKFNEEMKDDEALADAGKQEFAKLERYVEEGAGEGEANHRIWAQARQVSLAEFDRIYAQLGLKFVPWADVPENQRESLSTYKDFCIYMGESYFVREGARARQLIQHAKDKGVAVESDGAIVIFTHGEKKPPLILVKNDGATSYHARDLAAALFREEWFGSGLDEFEMTYAVGGEQKWHFEQLFKSLELLGFAFATKCSHTDFGLMLFKQADGKWTKMGARKGNAIMLEDLLDESVKAVREIMKEKNPELAGTPEAESIAQAVGVGAVVFNDLKNGRRNNVKFDWDAVLDFQGESGPYMQMQYVRMGSVTDKFRETYGEPSFENGDVALLTHEEEWKIIQQLAAFPDAVAKASAEFEPSVVARHLIELASLTSTWWTVTKDTRIVGDDQNLSLARVRLVNSIRKVLGRGLNLLGMSLVERM